jgi:hypothetical protein
MRRKKFSPGKTVQKKCWIIENYYIYVKQINLIFYYYAREKSSFVIKSNFHLRSVEKEFSFSIEMSDSGTDDKRFFDSEFSE